ncbi:neprilysin-1-like isoform X2 [Amblyomma americanum]
MRTWDLWRQGAVTISDAHQDLADGPFDFEDEPVGPVEDGPQEGGTENEDTSKPKNTEGTTKSAAKELSAPRSRLRIRRPQKSPTKRIARHHPPQPARDPRRLRFSDSDSTCSQPECLWYLHHIDTKLDRTINPCDDFYGHVCGPQWFAPNVKPTFEAESIEKLMSCLDLNIRVERHSPLRWVRNTAFLYQSCLTSNGSRAVREKLLAKLYRNPPSSEPVTSAPAVVFRIGLQEMVPHLQSEYLEHLRVHPLASVYLAPAGPHTTTGGKSYVPYVDTPELLLKRFLLRYPDLTEGDYKRLIEGALVDVENASVVASKIVHIEKRLLNIVSAAASKRKDRTLSGNRITALGNATVRWLSHLFPKSFGGRLNVRILDEDYVSHVVEMLKHVCTPADIADYFYFRTLVEYSSFLNITSLIPLSYDTHLNAVPLRVQGCLHMVENFYKHGMRILAIEALGGNLAVWRIPFQREVEALFDDVRRSLQRFVRFWFTSWTVDIALRKLRSMKLAYLGAKTAYPTWYAASTPETRSLEDFASLIKDAVRRDFNDTDNYDFLHRASVFSTSVEYNPDTNSLYVPHALVTMPVLFSETLHPIFVPILGAKMLQGIMMAIDVRGSDAPTEDGGYRSWWSPGDWRKFENRSACFREQLESEVRNVSPRSSFLGFHTRFTAESAAIEPLFEVYKRRTAERFPDGIGRNDERLRENRLFYYAYAMGQCERPGTDGVQIRFKHAIPARIRVNSALANFPGFQKTFRCRIRTKMAPPRRCTYWTT